MAAQQVETPADRLARIIRGLLAEEGRKGARTKEDREGAVAERIGWHVSTVQTWGGYKAKKSQEQLPRLDILARLLSAEDYSADYILFGEGPEKRATKRTGGRLTRDALAREIAAHLVPLVKDGQTRTIHAIDGREALRAIERAVIADRDFVQDGDGGWIDREAAALLRAVVPRLEPSERKDYTELAEFLKSKAAGVYRRNVQRIRSRDVRIVVDSDTMTDPDRPVYLVSDRENNGPPSWIVKVGHPPEPAAKRNRPAPERRAGGKVAKGRR